MRAFTVVAVSTILFFQNPSPSAAPKNPVIKQSAGSNRKDTAKKDGESGLPPSKSKDISQPSAPQSQDDRQKEQVKADDRIYKVDIVTPTPVPPPPKDAPLFLPYLIITSVGVFVNALIWFLIHQQTQLNARLLKSNIAAIKISARSARAAKRSADAAEKSADGLINAERAWVIPELEAIAVKKHNAWFYRSTLQAGHSPVTLTTQEVLAGKHLEHYLKLTNMGRTPAQIMHFRINCSFLEEGAEVKPDTPHEIIEDREFIKLLDSRESGQIEHPAVKVLEIIVKHCLNKTDGRLATFWGWVKYRHMFSTDKSGYADFCYVYMADGSYLASVGKYARQREEKD